MRKFKTLLLSSIVIVLFACSAESPDKVASDKASTAGGSGEFEKIFNEAEQAYKDAISMGAAWRDTDEILTKARAAAEGNDVPKAISLAQQALTQSQLAMKQSKEQQNAKPYLF